MGRGGSRERACGGRGARPVPWKPHALRGLGRVGVLVRRARLAPVPACAIGPCTLQVVVPEGAEPGDTLTLAMAG